MLRLGNLSTFCGCRDPLSPASKAADVQPRQQPTCLFRNNLRRLGCESVSSLRGFACPSGPRIQQQSSVKPFVLLPDLVFKLKARGSDEGSASVSLPITYEDLDVRHKAEIAKNLQQSLKACSVIESWAPTQTQTAQTEAEPLMAVSKGDAVEVLCHGPTGWTFGTKLESMLESRRRFATGSLHKKQQGWFPDWTLEYDPSTWAEECVEQFAKLPQELKPSPQLRSPCIVCSPFCRESIISVTKA